MRLIAPLAIAPLLALLPLAPPQEDEKAITPQRQDVTETIDLNGRFIPADFEEISIEADAYAGPLLFLDVVAHGSYVNAGDVIARFDLETIDDQIETAGRGLRTTEIQHEATVERAKIAEEAAQSQLKDAIMSMKRARKALEGWEKYELPFHERSNEISRQAYRYGIEDQEDELAQLEAMYRDDELVDATEEIVLKRSRRALASSKTSQKLFLDRQAYDDEYDTVQTGQRRLRAAESQEGSLDRLVRSQELDRLSRADGVANSEVGLAKKREHLEDLKKDRELLAVRAPRAGIVRHGGERSYLPGQTRPVHRVGGRGSLDTPLFCVADPDRLAVALAVSESQFSEVTEGMAVEVTALVTKDAKVIGILSVDRYPSAGSAHGAEGSFDAQVAIDAKLHGVVVGMRAKLGLVKESHDDVLTLPTKVVFGSGEDRYCWVATDDGGYRKVQLRIGPEKGDRIMVSGELDETTQVLLEEPQK